MGNRIAEFRAARGWSYREMAEHVSGHVTGSTISKLEKGQMELTQKWMQLLGDALGVRPAELIEADVRSTLVVGAVEAGAWVEALEWPAERQYPVQVPVRRVPPDVRTFALEVRGPSMNRRYPEGTVLICAKLIDLEEEPVVGKRYIVYRHRGSYTEATVKQLRSDATGVHWLWPDSDHPEHQLPIPLNGAPGEEIEVAARVLMRVQDDD